MRKLVLILVLFIFGLTSCEELANQTLPNDVVFFDLTEFIAKEVIRLNELNPELKKTTRVNNNSETKNLKLKDFGVELKIFQEADINKLAWIDKYNADTIFAGANLASIVYTAMEKKLTTKELKINYKNGVVSKIDILTQASSIVTDVEKQLIYEPGVQYSILSKQKTTGSDENEIEITALFLN